MSVVISIRIPRELKKALDSLGINYSDEIRKFLEDLVHRKMLERAITRALEIQRKIGKIRGNLAAEFIREDRDQR